MVILFGAKWSRHDDGLRSTAFEVFGGKLNRHATIFGEQSVPVLHAGKEVGRITLDIVAGQPVVKRYPINATGAITVILHRVGLNAWTIAGASVSALVPEPAN
jgi:hypothetical protein